MYESLLQRKFHFNFFVLQYNGSKKKKKSYFHFRDVGVKRKMKSKSFPNVKFTIKPEQSKSLFPPLLFYLSYFILNA